ncbi:hypothetical protein ABPG75_008786 [Micractinium tetrahymenae]
MTAAPLETRATGPKAHHLASQQPLLSPPPPPLPPPEPPLALSPTPSGLSSLLGSLSPPKAERGNFETGFLWFDLPPDSGPVVSLPAAPAPTMGPTLQPLLPMVQPTLLPVQQQQQQPQLPTTDVCNLQQVQQQQHSSSAPASDSRAGSKRGGGRGRARGSAAASKAAASEAELQTEKERKEEERRARNRATQARFRERQKAKNEAVLQEHAAAEAALRRGRSEREQLEAEQAVLQKMLFTKDAHIAALPPSQAGAAPGPAAAAAGAALTRRQPPGAAQLPLLLPAQPHVPAQPPQGTAAASAADSSSSANSGAGPARGLLCHLSSSELGAAPLSSAVAEQMGKLSSNLAAHLAQLELPVGADPDQAMAVAQANLPASPSRQAALQAAPTAMQLGPPGAVAGGSAAGAAAPAGAAGAAPQGGERQLEELMRERPDLVQKVQVISAEEFVADWRKQALAIRAVLEAHDLAAGGEAELARVLHFLREFSCLMGLALRLRPAVAQALFATAADAPPGRWEAVAAAIAPTRAQRTAICQLWHAYAGQVQALSAERAAAIQAVHHAATHPPAAGRAAGFLPADTLGALMSRYLGLFDAAGKLSTLRDAEFIAMLQFLGRIGLVFSPVQKARLAAVSCPHFPDIVQISRLLAEEGEAEHGQVEA